MRLKELLADGFNPHLTWRVANAILDAAGPGVGDMRTAWSRDAKDLIQISLTLQRIDGTRTMGLDLFKRLLDLGAYEATKVLNEIDRTLA
jgi:hypothetical protein